MSAQDDSKPAHGKGTFPREYYPGRLQKYYDGYDAINWKKRPQNTVLISGDALKKYVEHVEETLGPVPDGVITTFSCICTALQVNSDCMIHGKWITDRSDLNNNFSPGGCSLENTQPKQEDKKQS